MSDWPNGWYKEEPGSRGTGQVPPVAAGSGHAAWSEQPPVHRAPGLPVTGRPGRAGPGTGRRRRFWGQPGRRGRRIALIAGSVAVILVVALAGSYFYVDSKLNRSVTLPVFPASPRGRTG